MPEGRRIARHTDVVVVGSGLVGLTVAFALAQRGARVTIIGHAQDGEASPAAAGLLAPSVEWMDDTIPPLALAFAIAARDSYIGYVAELEERTGRTIPYNRLGVLDIALDDATAAALHASADRPAMRDGPAAAQWLDRDTLADAEPSLAHATGAVLFPRDGTVDNRALLSALWVAVQHHSSVISVESTVHSVHQRGKAVVCQTAHGELYGADCAVLAAGAWTPRIAGLPRPLPIEPVRGQIVALCTSPAASAPQSGLRRAAYGPGGYLVPRSADQVLVGTTMERAGFDAATTAAGRSHLMGVASVLCPSLAGLPVADAWAGLRPMTPDRLPILGPDPDWPAIVYACGHSRNGILLAPFTATCIAAAITGTPRPADITPFSVARF